MNPPTPTPGLDPAALLTGIQTKLLDQSGMVSSTNSDLQNSLQTALSGVKDATKSTDLATTSSYDRQIADAQDKGSTDIIAGRAAGAGGILNIGALRAVTQTIDKNVNDLEQRKQELILQNDAAGASKLADMQFQALQFKQQAQQQTFSNLLGIANFGIQAQSQALQQKAQTFQEQQVMSTTALKYGLTLQPGDTLASVTTRAMPLASKEEQLSLAKAQAEINSANAQAAKYMSDVNSAKSGLDPLSASVLASNYASGDATQQTAILTSILNSKNPKDMATFQAAIKTANDQKESRINDAIPQLAGLTLKQIDNALASSASPFSPTDVASIKAKVAAYQQSHPSSSKSSNKQYGLGDLGSDAIGSFMNLVGGVAGFTTGQQTPNHYDYTTKSIKPR